MTRHLQVVLVTGPAGSGKTTLATHLADRLGWLAVGEDEYWVRHGWSGRRTAEQEAALQEEVGRGVLAALARGQGVVLEFILYAPAPNPLTAYRRLLDEAGVGHATIVLAPPVDAILDRMRSRGRATDLADLDGRRRDAEWQLTCLRTDGVAPAFLVTDPALTPAQVCDTWLPTVEVSRRR